MCTWSRLDGAQKACFPDAGLLRQQVDAWTEAFEGEEARRRESAAASLAEEGWTVVKRKGVSVLHEPVSACVVQHTCKASAGEALLLLGLCRAGRRTVQLWGVLPSRLLKPLPLARRWALHVAVLPANASRQPICAGCSSEGAPVCLQERSAVNFYRFQQRDKRRSGEPHWLQGDPFQPHSCFITISLGCCAELMELRQKFAEDKRRIAELKASRKFNI